MSNQFGSSIYKTFSDVQCFFSPLDLAEDRHANNVNFAFVVSVESLSIRGPTHTVHCTKILCWWEVGPQQSPGEFRYLLCSSGLGCSLRVRCKPVQLQAWIRFGLVQPWTQTRSVWNCFKLVWFWWYTSGLPGQWPGFSGRTGKTYCILWRY